MKDNFHLLFFFFLLIVLAVGAVGTLQAETKASGQSGAGVNSLYDRILKCGKIRAAYAVYPPYCTKDPISGKLGGIGVEALELVAKKLGLIVEFTEEVGWGNMVEGLQSNRYDIVACPVWTNANRAKIADFSRSLFFSPVFAYAREGDLRFKHTKDIDSSNINISSIDGTTEDLIAQTDFPKAKHLTMPQLTDISQNFLNVAAKKADIVLAEPGFASRFIKTNPHTLKIVDLKFPLRIYSTSWIFKRGQPDFKSMINTILEEVINSGEMERIIRKYEPNKDAIFLVAAPYRTH